MWWAANIECLGHRGPAVGLAVGPQHFCHERSLAIKGCKDLEAAVTTESEDLALWSRDKIENLESASLKDVLTLMSLSDEGAIELTFDEMKALAHRVKSKADGYHDIDEELEAQDRRLTIRIEDFTRERRRVRKDRDNLKKLLLWNMQQNGLSQLPGNDYVVKRRKNPPKVVAKAECDNRMKIKFPNLVRVKYEWALTEVKKVLKTAKPEDDIHLYFDLQQDEKVKFEVNKGRLYE